MLRKQQSCKIFVVNKPIMFRKVQRTEISLLEGVGALHLDKWLIDFATNIGVLCTLYVTSVDNWKKVRINNLEKMRLMD